MSLIWFMLTHQQFIHHCLSLSVQMPTQWIKAYSLCLSFVLKVVLTLCIPWKGFWRLQESANHTWRTIDPFCKLSGTQGITKRKGASPEVQFVVEMPTSSAEGLGSYLGQELRACASWGVAKKVFFNNIKKIKGEGPLHWRCVCSILEKLYSMLLILLKISGKLWKEILSSYFLYFDLVVVF